MRWWVNVFAVLAIVFLVFGVPFGLAVGFEEASVAVSDADGALRGTFVAVLDAESSGANVSGLMGRLNEAGVALTGARVALAAGNYSDAVGRAGECRGLADSVALEAGVLNNDAAAQASRWWVTVLLSVTGSVVFVVVLSLVWRRFKRYYADRLLGSKPEVAA
jgi:hypothetical protein